MCTLLFVILPSVSQTFPINFTFSYFVFFATDKFELLRIPFSGDQFLFWMLAKHKRTIRYAITISAFEMPEASKYRCKTALVINNIVTALSVGKATVFVLVTNITCFRSPSSVAILLLEIYRYANVAQNDVDKLR